ncbi:MAG: DUF4920 domain-containing protein [Planctomycetes bacterium]|nr:DUF4920 domain-containing protein [Planctomycetota bacterium]
MKRIAFVGLLLGAACAATGPAPQWKAGRDFAAGPTMSLDGVAKAAAGSEIQIAGSVTRVCQGRGCWVELSDGKTQIIAKSLGHDVLFPKDCVGRQARVMGVVRVDPPSECKGGEGGHGDHECPKPKVLVEIVGAHLY